MNLIIYIVFIYLLLEDMENEYINVPGGFELPTKEETKFIKLFEEYLLKYNSEYGPINCSINIPGITLMGIHESVIISKKFGFIEWLVRENKIDFELPIETLSFREYYDIKKSDFLIMILSIQDNPIEYLCSILKE